MEGLSAHLLGSISVWERTVLQSVHGVSGAPKVLEFDRLPECRRTWEEYPQADNFTMLLHVERRFWCHCGAHRSTVLRALVTQHSVCTCHTPGQYIYGLMRVVRMLNNVESSSLPFSSAVHTYCGHANGQQASPGRNTKRRATGVEYQDQALELCQRNFSMGVLRREDLRLVFRITKNVRICLSVYGAERSTVLRSLHIESRVCGLLRVQ